MNTLTESVSVAVTPSPLAQIQVGPVYHCFVCGAQSPGLTPWLVNHRNPCRLDEWAAHIWYMVRPCGCRGGGRVARLGDCITPLDLPNDRGKPYMQMVDENVAAVHAALKVIAQHVPPSRRTVDAPTRLVLQLMAGLLPPARAIDAIRRLMQLNGPYVTPGSDVGASQ